MTILELNVYNHPSGVAFDPEKVIEKARQSFPEATFVPGDRSVDELEWIEAFLDADKKADPKAAQKVRDSARRKAQRYGPAFAFYIPIPDGPSGSAKEPERPPWQQREMKPLNLSGHFVRGLARSSDVTFHCDVPPPSGLRDRLISFLKSLGVGRLEAAAEGQKAHKVLADLHGPSDCLRADVPWLAPC